MSKAAPLHWMAVKRIMRHLKGTLDFTLYLRGNDIASRGFCDVDWAGDANNQRCTMGCIFLLALESFRGNARNN